MEKLYQTLDSSGITLDLFCELYKIDATELVEEGTKAKQTAIDFITRMEG